MKRRRFVQALAAVPASPALLAQQPAPANPALSPMRSGPVEQPKIDIAVPEAIAEAKPLFFSSSQMDALRKLSDLLMPAMNGSPGALEAGVPEFLDFLIASSEPERQKLYRAGLDALNKQATSRFHKPFAEVSASDADALLSPLRAEWTYQEPADPLARFLRAVKHDVRTATVNSREYNASSTASGRRFGANGLYWYPLD